MFIKNDEGGVTVLVAALILGLLSVLATIGFAINLLITVNHLNNSADRIALAAATQLITNTKNACSSAQSIADSNHLSLVTCEVNDDEVVVQIRSNSEFQSWLDRWPRIGMARAGIDFVFD